MMKEDQAIVLRNYPYGENDLIVSVWTKGEGRTQGIAKGGRHSKKRFANCLELGSRIQLIFEEKTGRDLIFLKEASLKRASPAWRNSYVTILAVSFVAELALKLLPERNPAGEKFELLENFLEEITEKEILKKLVAFEFCWLSLSGLAPNLEACGVCGISFEEHPRWQLLLERGEILCPRCWLGNKAIVSMEDIQFLSGNLQPIFDHYWHQTLGRPLVSAKLLSELVL